MSPIVRLLVLIASCLLVCAQARTVRAAEPYHPKWTLCQLHYSPDGTYLSKQCAHYALLAESRHPIAKTWREISRTPTLSVRVTWPVFAPPPVDMSPRALACAGPWRAFIASASADYGVPSRAIAAVICVESGGSSCAVSSDGFGTIGLMQLMSTTAASVMGVSPEMAAASLCNPAFNIAAGTRYLRQQYLAFGHSWYAAAGAYNAGSFVNWGYVYSPNGFAHYYEG